MRHRAHTHSRVRDAACSFTLCVQREPRFTLIALPYQVVTATTIEGAQLAIIGGRHEVPLAALFTVGSLQGGIHTFLDAA
jgi:hypothetical protein